MGNQKLIIPPKKYHGDTAVVSSRLPNDLVGQLDEIASQTGRTRNEIVQMCLEYAIDHVEVGNSEQKGEL